MGTEQSKAKDCVLEIEVVEFGFDILVMCESDGEKSIFTYFRYARILLEYFAI